MKVLSLFSGIGAFESAFERLSIPYELVNYCEIDKYASCSYSAIHKVSESLNLKDVTIINPVELKNFDILTHGSPCQDFSVAGNQAGGNEGTNTRSSLMWCTVNIVKVKHPKIVIWENVKNVLSKRHRHNFDKYIHELDSAGYNSYYKVLNTKDYGIPQNRERIFVISIRKDLDNGKFEFPKPFDNGLRLKDMLENEVDEKYYLSEKMFNYVMSPGTKNFYYKPKIDLDIARPLTSTMTKMHRAGTDNYVSERFVKAVERAPLKFLNRNGKKTDGNYSFCVDTGQTGGIKEIYNKGFRIRKLTPLECWRLQGFTDEEFNIARNTLISTFYKGKDRANSQMYKQAGNSITVNVLVEIYKKLKEVM